TCLAAALVLTTRPRRFKPFLAWQTVLAAAIAMAIPALTLGIANGWRAVPIYAQRALQAPVHQHPWYYYLALLIRPHDAAGPIWSEALILLAAVLGLAIAVTVGPDEGLDRGLLRFLSVYACAITLAYSLIPYKTPWCVL